MALLNLDARPPKVIRRFILIRISHGRGVSRVINGVVEGNLKTEWTVQKQKVAMALESIVIHYT